MYLNNYLITNIEINTKAKRRLSDQKIDKYNENIYIKKTQFSYESLSLSPGRYKIRRDIPEYPIFYFQKSNSFAISPDFSIIFSVLSNCFEIDDIAIQEFILFNTPLEGKTIIKNVSRVFNISVIEFTNNKIGLIQKFEEPETDVFKKFKERVQDFCLKNVHVNKAILLSGGKESRINAAIAKKYSMPCFFISWGEKDDEENRVAKKISKMLKLNHKTLQITPRGIDYDNFLIKSGFLLNLKYAFRYSIIESIKKRYCIDEIWTGWGDISGFVRMTNISEFSTKFYVNLFNGDIIRPEGWSCDYLGDIRKSEFVQEILNKPVREKFVRNKYLIIGPAIYGGVLAAENTVLPIWAPWFSNEIYQAIMQSEKSNQNLLYKRAERTLWKNQLYYKLINHFHHNLNRIKYSDGPYPWMLRSKIGLPFAFIMKKMSSKNRNLHNVNESKIWIINELKKVIEEKKNPFNIKEIEFKIRNYQNWDGEEVSENLKIIQINKALNYLKQRKNSHEGFIGNERKLQ